MSARAFEITLFSRTARIVRSIIARSTVEALRIGIRMMPELDGPVGISCKPIILTRQEQPCAA